MDSRGSFGTLWRKIKREKSAYLLLAPSFILMSLFLGYPTVSAIVMSFLQSTVSKSKWGGILNYKVLIQDLVFRTTLINTSIFCGVTVPLIIVISLLLAALIFNLPRNSQSFFKAAFYLPRVCMLVALSIVWFYIFNPIYGLLNYFLSFFHLGPVQWLGNPRIALWSIMLMYTVTNLGLPILVYIAALSSIPRDLYESADMDGASYWSKFWRITIPLLMPATLFLVVIETIWSLQLFDQIYAMTWGGPVYATRTVVYNLYVTAFHDLDFGLGAAQSVILFIIIGVLSFFQFKWIRPHVE